MIQLTTHNFKEILEEVIAEFPIELQEAYEGLCTFRQLFGTTYDSEFEVSLRLLEEYLNEHFTEEEAFTDEEPESQLPVYTGTYNGAFDFAQAPAEEEPEQPINGTVLPLNRGGIPVGAKGGAFDLAQAPEPGALGSARAPEPTEPDGGVEGPNQEELDREVEIIKSEMPGVPIEQIHIIQIIRALTNNQPVTREVIVEKYGSIRAFSKVVAEASQEMHAQGLVPFGYSWQTCYNRMHDVIKYDATDFEIS